MIFKKKFMFEKQNTSNVDNGSPVYKVPMYILLYESCVPYYDVKHRNVYARQLCIDNEAIIVYFYTRFSLYLPSSKICKYYIKDQYQIIP